MEVYAAKHASETIRLASRSGGVFTALSDYYLSDGIIYGCVLDEKYEAIHIRATSEKDRNRMRGSKYIQSKMGDNFSLVKQDLEAGKQVLFSGTPCQIAGLKSFLQKEYNNLLCVDIVCYGVPSKKVWKKYLRWQAKKEKIIDVEFRNKKDFGWRAHVETIRTNSRTIHSDIFKKLFLSGSVLRPSCYECPYKSVQRPGDITLADYWGIEGAVAEFDDDKGVSLVLVNTEKGKELFEKVKMQLIWEKTALEMAMQPSLIAPLPKPETREEFWRDFRKKRFDYIVEKYESGLPKEEKPKHFKKVASLMKRVTRYIKG